MPIGQQAIRSQVGVAPGTSPTVALGHADRQRRRRFRSPAWRRWRSGAVDVAALRVGWFVDDGLFPPTPAVRRAVTEAADSSPARAPGDPVAPAGSRPRRGPDVRPARRGSLAFGRRILGASPRDPRIK